MSYNGAMTEEQAKTWAKDKNNQHEVIKQCVADCQNLRDAKIAIFMAGIPGAGKTEFVRNLQVAKNKEMIVIEHDQLVEYIEGYRAECYYTFRKAGSVLVTKLFDECLKRGYPFIFDGTLSHDTGFKNIEKCLKHGYEVIVIYIHQDIESAWRLTQDRELVKKRAIERDGFIQTCQMIHANLRKVFAAFSSHDKFAFWAIKKNGAPGLENSEMVVYDHSIEADPEGRSKVEELLSTEYNIETIKD